ncbi:MAG TPA: zeta toxin family protein [Candidatus Saccharimonadales bacterium]|nr:zeta toxin family protein [Candidatus Saccharimonadales bacterium]
MNDISEQAYRLIKKNKKQIINQFIPESASTNKRPIFMFMAGAPGAGKTEFSKNLIKILTKKIVVNGMIRIDADEIRELFRDIGYNGKNSDLFKRGCIKGVEILYDRCLKKKYHTVLDGTLSFVNIARRNIDAALKVGAKVFIVYVYQDPVIAWGFSQIREQKEGRRIEKAFFVKSLFDSIKNVNMLKQEYGNKIEVWLVEKNFAHNVENIKYNVDNIDSYLKIAYNSDTLINILYE